MPKVSFTIAGISVSASSADEKVVSEFRQDFALLATAAPAAESDINLRITLAQPPLAVKRTLDRLFPFKNGLRLRDFGDRRLISYPEGACLLYNYRKECGFLWTEHYHLARELSYLCALSRSGFLLDLKGLHRVHAAAVRLNGRTALICGPSGVGKSTLALLLAMDHTAALYSDDFPLANAGGAIFAFPARPAIGEDNYLSARSLPARTMERRKYGKKLLLEQPGTQIPEPAQIDFLILLSKRHAATAELAPACKMAGQATLLKNLVLGLGLPQIVELLLSFSPRQNLRLLKIAFLRALTAWRLAGRARCYRLTGSTSPEEAARLLAELLKK